MQSSNLPGYPFSSMSTVPDKEYPNDLMPGDKAEPLMTYKEKQMMTMMIVRDYKKNE